jgi:hypothetical protein
MTRNIINHDESVEPREIFQKLHLSDQIQIIFLNIQVRQIARIL